MYWLKSSGYKRLNLAKGNCFEKKEAIPIKY
jgi:hypothetical protein